MELLLWTSAWGESGQHTREVVWGANVGGQSTRTVNAVSERESERGMAGAGVNAGWGLRVCVCVCVQGGVWAADWLGGWA